ncbi:MAG: c-type cytochrome [Chloroflexota bacterium]
MMKLHSMILFALLGVFLAGCSFSLAEDITPPPAYRSPTPPADIGPLYPAELPSVERGAAIYADKCLACHGETGLGNGPMASQLPVAVPAIGLGNIAVQSTPAEWYAIVSRGRLERAMPPFTSLNFQQRWDVLAYIYMFSIPADELALGEALYVATCAGCHGQDGATLPTADLTDQESMAQVTGTGLARLIAEGVSPSMPGLGGQLTDGEIRSLVGFVRARTFDLSGPTVALAPDATPSVEAPTQDPASTEATDEEATETEAETPDTAGTEEATAVAEDTPTPEAVTVSIAGSVVHSTGASLPAGLTVTLHGLDGMSMQEMLSMDATVARDDSFSFAEIPPLPQAIMYTSVEYQGVSYFSDVVFAEEIVTQADLPVTIFDATTDFASLVIEQVHIALDFSEEGSLQIQAIYVISNTGPDTVVVETNGDVIPFIVAPEDATLLGYQLASQSAQLNPAENGFALLPGADLQYGIVGIYSMPYERRADLNQSFSLPVRSLALFVPDGVRVRSDQLTASGTETFQTTVFQLFEGGSLAAGESISASLSGKPEGQAGATPATQNTLVIGMGALGAVLIGVGIYLFLRDRKQSGKEEDEIEGVEDNLVEVEDALGNDPQELMDAIITLDDQFKAGEITKDAFERRRQELKARLKELL